MNNLEWIIDRVLKLDSKATKGDWECCKGSQSPDGCLCGQVMAGETRIASVHMNRCEVQDDGWSAPLTEESVANQSLIAEYRNFCPILARELREIQQKLLQLKAEVDSLMAAWRQFKERTS